MARYLIAVLSLFAVLLSVACGGQGQEADDTLSMPVATVTPSAGDGSTTMTPTEVASTPPTITSDITPQATQPLTDVRVTTDKLSYRLGEPIVVTVDNDLSDPIYSLAGHTYCSMVTVQPLEGGGAGTEGACPDGSQPALVIIPPRSQLSAALDPAAQEPGIIGPIVGQPVAPSQFDDDLRTLPTVEPWKPGDPIIVVPEGELDEPEPEIFGASSADSPLAQGRYRVEFSFRVGSDLDLARTAYSLEFIVTD